MACRNRGASAARPSTSCGAAGILVARAAGRICTGASLSGSRSHTDLGGNGEGTGAGNWGVVGAGIGVGTARTCCFCHLSEPRGIPAGTCGVGISVGGHTARHRSEGAGPCRRRAAPCARPGMLTSPPAGSPHTEHRRGKSFCTYDHSLSSSRIPAHTAGRPRSGTCGQAFRWGGGTRAGGGSGAHSSGVSPHPLGRRERGARWCHMRTSRSSSWCSAGRAPSGRASCTCAVGS